jgi:AhpD family alkylhydroperoxidase
MTWIKTIPYSDATGWLKSLYNRIKGPNDNVDNIMLAHSLRPHSMEGHLVLYKNVLHHTSNTLPKWYLECLGVYVSLLNRCDYCVDHHFQGLKRLLNDDLRTCPKLTPHIYN